MDIKGCIPKDKFDTAAIKRASQIGFPILNPILSDLLGWVQDANWPVAPHTASLLSTAGVEILPHIRAILNSEDGVWKYWTIELVVTNLSSGVQIELRDELARLAGHPTKDDQLEAVDVAARGILNA